MDYLFIDFLNSDWRDWRGSGRTEDRLDRIDWMESFMEKWKLAAPLPVDQKNRKHLGELRAAMRNMTEAIVSGAVISPQDLEAINRALSLAPAYSRLEQADERFQINQVASSRGWALVISQIAASFATFLVQEEVHRLKICDNQDCCWIFYDESRNRVRRWCDDKMCGNLMKVRRFRERQRNKGEA